MKKKKFDGKKIVSLSFTNDALAILAMIGPITKNQPRREKRLARIRLNLMREVDAINRELMKHKPKIKVTQHQHV